MIIDGPASPPANLTMPPAVRAWLAGDQPAPRRYVPVSVAADELGYSVEQVVALAKAGLLRCQWRGDVLLVEPALVAGRAVQDVLAAV